MRKKQFIILLSTYILIVVLYTTLLIGITLYKNKQFSYVENNYKNEIFLSKLATHLDEKINLGLGFVDDISSLPAILDYANTSDNDYILITSIFNDLKDSFNKVNLPFFSIGITRLTDLLVITPKSTENYERFLSSININSNKLPYLPLLFENNTNSSYYIIPKSMYIEESPNVNIIRKVDSLSDPIYYFLTVHIDDLIKFFNTTEENLPLLLFTDEIVYNSTSIDYSSISDLLNNYKSELPNVNKYEVHSFSSNKFYNYTIQSQALPSIKYLYTVNSSSFYNNLTYLSKDIIVLNVFLLLIGILLIYFMLKKAYNPINKLLNLFNSKDTLKINNKHILDEFEFIKDNILHLNTHNEELYKDNKLLQELLSNSKSNLQEDFLRKILYGVLDEALINSSLNDLDLLMLKNGGILCILDIQGLSKLESNFSKSDILSFRRYILSNFKINNNFNIFIVPIDFEKYCLIFDVLEKEFIEDKITDIILSLESESALKVASYMSAPVDNILNFCDAFTEVSTLLENNYVSNKNKSINIDTISTQESIYSYPLDVERNIIYYIENLNIEKALDLLSNILDKNSHLDIYNTNNLKYALLNTIKRLLNNKEQTLKQFYKNNPDLLNNFSKCNNNELKNYSIQIFNKIFESYFKHNFENVDSPIVANILLYIQNNFDKDISLSTVSNEFNLSEGYISKLLKDSANVNFKNYLNTIRVKKAKELLSQGNYKVNEVGKMVGFENTNSFIRMFKKYESVSPGEFVKLFSSINSDNVTT